MKRDVNITGSLSDKYFGTDIEIMNKFRISPTELMFIRTALIAQYEGNPELHDRYSKLLVSIGIQPMEIIYSLIDKKMIFEEYIETIQDSYTYNPKHIPFNNEMINSMYSSYQVLGEELFNHYPVTGIINGNSVCIRTISKKFDSLENAFMSYAMGIRYNLRKHMEVIGLLDWATENGMINMSLGSFIVDKQYENLKVMRQENYLITRTLV